MSRNHYSPGAVCQWLFETVAGIQPDGERRFLIAPKPGGTLTYAQALYASIYGEVKSSWKITDAGTVFEFRIYANTVARIHLPNGTQYIAKAGKHVITIA